ncbi:MAG: glycosyltransferase [Arenicellales bacterium]
MAVSIHYYSSLQGTGYGDAAAAYIDGLLQYGVEIKWAPLVWTPVGLKPYLYIPERFRPSLDRSTRRSRKLIELMYTDVDPEVLFLHVMPELYQSFTETDKPKIGYTVWETTQLPKHWPSLVRHVDQLIVPCQFNQPLFSVEGGPPVAVIPHIADTSLAVKDTAAAEQFRRRWQIEPSTLVFYNISSWHPRKAIWDTLHTYLLAFTHNDDVCFILKTDQLGYDYSNTRNHLKQPTRDMVEQIIAAYPDPARVILIDESVPQNEIRALHAGADCYFSLSHSEGWGMGAFNAGAAGNAVVITGWGGQLDFLDTESAYLVDYKLITVAEFSGFESYTRDQSWASADVEHGISLLNRVFHDQEEARDKAHRLQKSILEKYTSDVVTKNLVEVIDSVRT